MLYDKTHAPRDRFISTQMPIPADAAFEKEQGHIEIIAMKKNFAIEYLTLDHPSTLRDRQVETSCKSSPFPSHFIFRSVTETLNRMEMIRRTGRENLDTILPKGSTAEIMNREAHTEVVFSGPEYLYREPRCNTKCSKMLMGQPVDVSEVPTRSSPTPFAKRLVSSFSEELSKQRARRDCAAAMNEIVQKWESKCSSGTASSRFLDASFFLGSRCNLYPIGTCADSNVPEPRDLASIFQLFPNVNLFADAEGDSQYVIPMCRSTHLVAAIEAVLGASGGKRLLQDLFVIPHHPLCTSESDFIRKFGFVGVLLYIDGAWEWVVVDDLIPTDVHGTSPLMLHLFSKNHTESLQTYFGPFSQQAIVRGRTASSSGARSGRSEARNLDGSDDPVELWPHLLQKAVAKWYGCYDAIDGGCPRYAMEMLTGGAARFFNLAMDSSMGGFDAFDDEITGKLCLVYLTREMRLAARREAHLPTDTFYFQPRRSPPKWLPQSLPLVVLDCFTSNADATPMVRLSSPWGALGSVGGNTVSLEWSEFVQLCDYFEVCTLPDKDMVYVEGFGVSSPSFTHEFNVSLRAPLRASVVVSLRQADPRSHLDLPLSMRRNFPFVGMSMSVIDAVNRRVVFEQKEKVVAMSFEVELRLLPAEYTVRLHFDETPQVPFGLRLSASTLVSLRLWPKGLHPEVNGASTLKLPLIEEDSPNTIGYDLSARDVSGADDGRLAEEAMPIGAREAFEHADLLEKGSLDLRAAERAAAEYFFTHTPEGRHVRDRIRSQVQSGGEISLTAFAALIGACFPSPGV